MTSTIQQIKNVTYHKLFTEFKKNILTEENYGQVSYLERKLKEANKLLDQIYENSKFSNKNLFIAKVYILYFYFRLLNFNEKITPKILNNISNKANNKVVSLPEICRHFKLSASDTEAMQNAFTNFHKPINNQTTTGIKLGHDAVTILFGKKKIVKKLEDLLNELEFYFPSAFTQFKISGELLEYLSKTRYYSSYAIENYAPQKLKNKAVLVKHIQKQRDESSLMNNKQAMTMFKTSSRNQIDLKNIADKKAGIMITVNSILLTLLIPLFASYIFDFSSFIIPVAILAVTCGLTILLATLATRPSICEDEMTNEKISTGQKSIFYFKNFANLSKKEFVNEVQELLNKDSAFEKSVFTDLYDVGVDLDRKYKRLRWCYTIFGTGIIFTMLSFVFCIIYYSAS